MNNKVKKRVHKNRKKRYNKKLLVSIFSIILILIITWLTTLIFIPTITLVKDNKEIDWTITINYKTDYKKPKYSATYFGKDITKYVSVTGVVNAKKIGDYKIIYKSSKGVFAKKRTLTVKVRDIASPSIKLIGLNKTHVCPGTTYKEEGYEAYDNYDGVLTKSVKVKKYKDKIIYTVIDKSGNKKEKIRQLIYKDIQGPIIELKGGTTLNVYMGEKFSDPGFTANDNCDKDVTKNVKITGKVNTTTFGKQQIIYTVNDEAKNKSTIKRDINIIEHGQNGTIYLTFDDGPKIGITDKILDILRDENVKATFFVTNNGPDQLIKRAYDEGHTVALHTATHDYSYLYSSVANYYEDLYSVRNRVKNLTGYESNIIRFPGGSSNTISKKFTPGIMTILTKDILLKGFKYYDWNLSSGDAGEIRTSDGIYNNVIKNLSKSRINNVLMHDVKPYTRDALQQIIRYGKDNGYIFDKITDKTEMITQRVNN